MTQESHVGDAIIVCTIQSCHAKPQVLNQQRFSLSMKDLDSPLHRGSNRWV